MPRPSFFRSSIITSTVTASLELVSTPLSANDIGAPLVGVLADYVATRLRGEEYTPAHLGMGVLASFTFMSFDALLRVLNADIEVPNHVLVVEAWAIMLFFTAMLEVLNRSVLAPAIQADNRRMQGPH